MGHLYRYATRPIAHAAPFSLESDLETFLAEHRALLAEHLSSGDNEGAVDEIWRQMVLPGGGRLDLLFLLNDGGSHVLFLAELKNEAIGKSAVNQVAGYLEAWRTEANVNNRARIATWLETSAGLDASRAGGIALDVQCLLVAPSYTPEGIEALVERAKKAPASPVQALKLLRFQAEEGGGFIILVDDMFLRRHKGKRRTIRWIDLHQRFPDLVTEQTPFIMVVGGETFEALPDFHQGRGKNFRLVGGRDKALAALGRAEQMAAQLSKGASWGETEQRYLSEVHAELLRGGSVSMSRLSLYLQRCFGGEKEPDWQRPADLWRLKDDSERTIYQLDALLK